MKRLLLSFPLVFWLTSYVFASYNLVQEHYRWRYDDGSETSATWCAPADTPVTNYPKNTPLRLRISIANTGDDSYNYDLNYFYYLDNTNSMSGDYIPVDLEDLNPFAMATSAYIYNEEYTTEQLPGSGTFLPLGYCTVYPTNYTPIRLFDDFFSNYELCLKGTRFAIGGKRYFVICVAVDEIDNYAEISFASVLPSNQAKNISYVSKYPDAEISFDEGDGPLRIVVAKKGVVTNWWLPENGVEYSADSNFTNAPEITNGFKIVYKGFDNKFYLKGITNGIYSLRVFEYDGVGEFTVYNTNAAPDNPKEINIAFSLTNYVGFSGEVSEHYFTNIQAAINNTLQDGVVFVSNGVYDVGGENVDYYRSNRVELTREISVVGVENINKTLIVGGQYDSHYVRCVKLGENCLLANVTLTNGYLPSNNNGGGAILNTGSVLSNCVIVSCYANNGGGVAANIDATLINCKVKNCDSSSDGGGAFKIIARNSDFVNNHCGSAGGGLYRSFIYNCNIISNNADDYGGGTAWSKIENSTIAYNYAANYGGGIFGDTYRSSNLKIYKNIAHRGGGGAAQTFVSNSVIYANIAETERGGGTRYGMFWHCTIIYNEAYRDGGGTYYGGIYNSIVYYNSSVTKSSDNWYGGAYEYSCTTPAHSGTGNITSDPELASYSHISAGSPCIGAGDSSKTSGVDIDGEAWRNPPSIGCDEFYADSLTGALSVKISVDKTQIFVNKDASFYGLIEGNVSNSIWNFGDGTLVTNIPMVTHQWADTGAYDVILTAFNETYPNGIADTVTVQVIELDLEIMKEGFPSIAAGDFADYYISLTNKGNYAAENVTVNDYLPTGFTAESPTTFDLGTLPALAGTSLFVRAKCPIDFTGDEATNVVVVTSSAGESNYQNNTSTWISTIIKMADAGLQKNAPKYLLPGDSFEYTFTVTNTGPSLIEKLVITDSIPREVYSYRHSILSNCFLIYNFNESSFNNHSYIKDYSVHGNDAEVLGTGASSVPGIYHRAIKFSGIDNMKTEKSIDLTDKSFSICFWVKRTWTGSGNDDYVCGAGDTLSDNHMLHVGFRSNNKFTFAFWYNDLDTPDTYTDTNWHHWACVYDASTRNRRIYRDAILIAEDTASSNLKASAPFYVGSAPFDNSKIQGTVDDFLLFLQPISSNDIVSIVNSPIEYGWIENTNDFVLEFYNLYPDEERTYSLGVLLTNSFSGYLTNCATCYSSSTDTNTLNNTDCAVTFVTELPIINISTTNQTVGYDTESFDVNGEAYNIAGNLEWTNSLTGGSGSISISNFNFHFSTALDHGDNYITVSGTNIYGQSTNSVVCIRRETWNDVYPFILITNENTTVNYSVNTYTIAGTNNENVVGGSWTNSLTGGSGSISISNFNFQFSTALDHGDNYITVSGTNIYGQSTNSVVCIRRKTSIEARPHIATNALIFPCAGARLLVPFSTNIIWDLEKITDDTDGTNLTITKISIHIAGNSNEVANVTNDVSNLLGEIQWQAPYDLLSYSTNYVFRFEVVDSDSLTNSRIFADNEFTIIPEPCFYSCPANAGVLFIILLFINRKFIRNILLLE